MRASYDNHLSGFSLIELLVTLTVLAVLVGVGQPMITTTLEMRRVSGAAEAVQTTLQFARSEGIKQMRPMVVTYAMDDTDRWRVGIRDSGSCDTAVVDPEAEAACSIPEGGARILKVFDSIAFPGVIADASRSLTRFDPARGTAMGTNATVWLRSPGGKEVRVIVSNMGRVRMCSPAGDASVPGYANC